MNHSRLLLLLLTTLSITTTATAQADPEQLFTQQPSVMPSLANARPATVGVTTLRLTHLNQINAQDFSSRIDRALTVEVWYPALPDSNAPRATYSDLTRSGKPFTLQGRAARNAKAAPLQPRQPAPLVVLSHGYTGYRSMFFDLAEHLASHGYVVVSIDHTDSTNAHVDFAKNPGSGFMSTLLNRARDQQFVLTAVNQKESEFKHLIDPQRAAVIGYSMGGFGVLNTVGGCYNFPTAMLAGFGLSEPEVSGAKTVLDICNAGAQDLDPRWRGFVAIAPWGGEQGVHNQASLANIKAPGLFIAGELDDVSGYTNGVSKLFKQTRGDSKYMMVYENARHNIAAHPAPRVAYDNDLDIGHYFEPAWSSETISRINNHMILAFLNCHVRAQNSNCNALPTSQSSDQLKQADGSLSPAWPGFKERWATGLQFHRHPQ